MQFVCAALVIYEHTLISLIYTVKHGYSLLHHGNYPPTNLHSYVLDQLCELAKVNQAGRPLCEHALAAGQAATAQL